MSGQMGSNTDLTPPTVVADEDRRGMMWRLFHSLRGRLIALVLLGAVPGLGAILYTAETQRQRDAAAAQAEAMRTVQFVAGTQRELFAETQRLLQVLAQLPAVHEGSAASCSALLTHLHKQDPAPRYSSFFAVRPDGDVFCSSSPLTRRINAADQAYYRRVLATRAFAVGDYQIGRITGRAIIVLAQPVLDAAGAVRAVVGAGIDLAWLNRLAAEARLPVARRSRSWTTPAPSWRAIRTAKNGSAVPWRARPSSRPCTRSTTARSRSRASTASRASTPSPRSTSRTRKVTRISASVSPRPRSSPRPTGPGAAICSRSRSRCS